MSIIEQILDPELLPDAREADRQQEPFSWERVKERSRQIRISMGLPAEAPPDTEEMRRVQRELNQVARNVLRSFRQGNADGQF